jgi:hypothetical protein
MVGIEKEYLRKLNKGLDCTLLNKYHCGSEKLYQLETQHLQSDYKICKQNIHPSFLTLVPIATLHAVEPLLSNVSELYILLQYAYSLLAFIFISGDKNIFFYFSR